MLVCTECLWSVSAPVFVVLTAVGSKNEATTYKSYQCMTSYLFQPRYRPASLPLRPPVPMTKTFISVTVFVICFCSFSPFLFVLLDVYCSV